MYLRLSVFFFIVICISACSIYTEFYVHKPIEIKKLKKTDAIILINRCPAKTPNTHLVIALLKEYLLKFNHYKTLFEIPKQIYVKNNADSITQPLEWYEIDSICNIFNTHYILSLEEYTEFKHPYFSLKNKDNKELLRVKWRLYSSEKPRIVYEHFRSYKATNYCIDTGYVYQFLFKDNRIINPHQLAAYEIALKISDFWVDIMQTYYVAGNKMIKKAARLTYDNKWAEAANIWLALTKHTNLRIRRYALHNLAIYYAARGNYLTAMEFLQKSLDIKNNTYSKETLNILKEQLYIETHTLINTMQQKYLSE